MEDSDLFISESLIHSLVETGWALMLAFDTDTVLPHKFTYIHMYCRCTCICTFVHFQGAHLYTSSLHTPTLSQTHLHTCMFIVRPHIHFHTSTPAHSHMYVYAHTLLHTSTCTLLHVHTSTHTHTHTHMCFVYAHTHTRPERSISATLSVACSIRFSTSFFWLREKTPKNSWWKFTVWIFDSCKLCLGNEHRLLLVSVAV